MLAICVILISNSKSSYNSNTEKDASILIPILLVFVNCTLYSINTLIARMARYRNIPSL
jgi:hypothetical protein